MWQVIYTLILALIAILAVVTNWYTALGIILMLVLLIIFLNKIGKGIVLLETIALLYAFSCILMPIIGYTYYTSQNSLAQIWVRYMPVSAETYFSYALPAIACFCMAVTLPSFRRNLPDEGKSLMEKITRIRQILNTQKNIGLQIVCVGVLISFVTKLLPIELNYFAQLFFFGSFAGLLYIHFSPDFKRKKMVMALFVCFILWNALQTGMFTIVAYMGITVFSFFQINKPSGMLKKMLFTLVTIAFFILLQNVKVMYRKKTWKDSFGGNKVEVFSDLVVDNVQKGNALLSQDALFPLYSRANQGFNVALVMRRIPAVQPFDNGDRLLTVFASALVPRFLWPDKPEAGGVFNMKYYAGYTLKGWSTNIGPLGEAYGSFGVTGGIIYMLLLGFGIRWVYLKFFSVSNKVVLLICWLPVLFYFTISSAETDSLQIMNSILKSAFFIWLLYKFLPRWFGMAQKNKIKRAGIQYSKNVPVSR